jgi:hypothetical protein
MICKTLKECSEGHDPAFYYLGSNDQICPLCEAYKQIQHWQGIAERRDDECEGLNKRMEKIKNYITTLDIGNNTYKRGFKMSDDKITLNKKDLYKACGYFGLIAKGSLSENERNDVIDRIENIVGKNAMTLVSLELLNVVQEELVKEMETKK